MKIKDVTGVNSETRKKIVDIIITLMPDAKIYVHGSRADGTYRQGSDIDIALDTGYKIPWRNVQELHDVLNALRTKHCIDVMDINNTSKNVKEIIESEKIVWKS